ncbi:hypothetical protein BKA56DRAFT_497640 [Ilyonectria sp. MPI-CAGE-AT-0026]|nr:hypothetical protein BKA56DRAFT_497640 [Ilyonectria sp. MPI-CAGE-AT-0026]
MSQDKIPSQGQGSASDKPVKSKLPPLSDKDFETYNRLAVKMNYFHESFRQIWKMLHTTASTGRRPHSMSLTQFIDEGLHFVQHLAGHHGFEERVFFPMLAPKMPEFRDGRGELLQQHKEIHKGMDGLEDYLRSCRGGEVELDMHVLKKQLDTWGAVLWQHLDQEVETLGAENMRRYWTLDEIKRIIV